MKEDMTEAQMMVLITRAIVSGIAACFIALIGGCTLQSFAPKKPQPQQDVAAQVITVVRDSTWGSYEQKERMFEKAIDYLKHRADVVGDVSVEEAQDIAKEAVPELAEKRGW